MGTENKLHVRSSLLKHLVFYREDLIVLGPTVEEPESEDRKQSKTKLCLQTYAIPSTNRSSRKKGVHITYHAFRGLI